MDKTRESKIYHRVKNQLFFLGLLVDVVVLLFLSLSGLSVAFRDFAVGYSSYFAVTNAIYITIFGIGMNLIHFPLRFFEGFLWEHRFRLSNQNFSAWLSDDFKKALLQGVVVLIAVEIAYLFIRQYPKTWWIGTGCFWLLLTLVIARLTPTVVIPLFYKYSPIENQELKNRILKLFEESAVKVKGAYLINFSSKTKKANAFFCGLGKSRRVILTDNLVREFSIPEIETVIAHEIGHYKNHDTLKMTLVNSSVVFLGFFLVSRFLDHALQFLKLKRIDDIAFFPVVALAFTVLGFVAMPLLNGYSRKLEVGADAFSLKLTRNPRDFISMIQKLGTMNLAECKPNAFIEVLFYTHPPIAKRIQFAETFHLSGSKDYD